MGMYRERPMRGRSRAFRAFERLVLGMGMSVVVFVAERKLLKALRKGRVEPAPRTAAERGETLGEGPPREPREGELATAPHQVGDQPGRQ
jgi:hypothetical protein